jgi:hypothetical protein
VALAEVQTVIRLKARRPPVPPARRVYIEARGLDAYNGVMPAGQELRYLADLPLDARGKLPQMKKARMVLFARPVVGGNGEVQLIAGDAQLAWSPAGNRLRTILGDLASQARRRASPGSAWRCISRAIWWARARRRSSSTPPTDRPPPSSCSTRAGRPALVDLLFRGGERRRAGARA